MNKIIKLYENPEVHMPFSIENGLLKWYGNQAENRRRAFEISINKWQIIARDNPRIYGEGSSDTCGLCHLYYEKSNCGNCPVARAGHVLCTKTPYEDWHKELSQEHAHAELDFDCMVVGRDFDPISLSQEHAHAELDFLIKLAEKHGFEIKEVHNEE